MDERYFEMAAEMVDRERDERLLAMRNAQVEPPVMIDGKACCNACESPLSDARLATGAGRCVECQEIHERRAALYRR